VKKILLTLILSLVPMVSSASYVPKGNTIVNENTLQAGSTAYPQFLYVGSSATVLGNLSVTGPSLTDAGQQVLLSTGTLEAGTTDYPQFLYVGSSATVLGNLSVTGPSLTDAGQQVLLSTGTLQAGSTAYPQFLYVGSTATVSKFLDVGSTVTFGGSVLMANAANGDNYIAYPFICSAAIAAKQIVIVSGSGTVSASTAANALTTVIGIAVTATSGANQTVWVATSGIVTGVTAGAAVTFGQSVETSNAGAGQARSVAGGAVGANIGKVLTSAAAGATFTVALYPG
jgi:hypothetical protein